MIILDAKKNSTITSGASFTLRNRLYRLIWILIWKSFASWTPPAFRRWRIALLRFFGAEIHWTAQIYSSCEIWYPPNLLMEEFSCLGPRVRCYNIAPIRIGSRSIVSQGAFLCTGSHNYRDENFQLIASSINIGSHVWIAAEAFVGPGIKVGDRAVLGARGVAFRDLNAGKIYIGNPAVPK